MSYPYDPETRERVAALLFQALPALYRVMDAPPEGRGELEGLLRVLAAPLAMLRQDVEELHADLFIDSAAPWVLPLLAEMVGTTTIYGDPETDRRDLRRTLAWRRRKGTPAMLQELARSASGGLAVTQEGWRWVQMTQDLSRLRPERRVPDLTPAVMAEMVSGPLVATHHAVDLRAIGPGGGQFHPRHLTHWLHPTLLHEVPEGTPVDLGGLAMLPEPVPDQRFAIHPLGASLPLRAKATDADDGLRTDRVPPLHFAGSPGDWHDRPGRFSVRICGLSAAMPRADPPARRPSTRCASRALVSGATRMTLLDHAERGQPGTVAVELHAVPAPAAGGGVPDMTAASLRCRLELDGSASAGFHAGADGDPAGAHLAMLRLEGLDAGGRFFPGAVLEIVGGHPGAIAASSDPALAREGFLDGALIVHLPPLSLLGSCWLYVAADGSLYRGQSGVGGAVDRPLSEAGEHWTAAIGDLAEPGPGATWPSAAPVAEPDAWGRLPTAPGAGPRVMHGGRVLVADGDGYREIAVDGASCLAFALARDDGTFRPFVGLGWTGPDASTATWLPLDADGRPATALVPDRCLGALAEEMALGSAGARLAVRFECAAEGAVLTPAEVAFTAWDGACLLLYLAQLRTRADAELPDWGRDTSVYPHISRPLWAARDGSSWWLDSGEVARRALGQVAPLQAPATLRRRIIGYRALAAWDQEAEAGCRLAPTTPGRLDLDPANGRFALAPEDAIQAPATGPDGVAPGGLSVRFQDGFTDHIGARCAAREPLLSRRLPLPTRLVSASGHLSRRRPWSFIHGEVTQDAAVLGALDFLEPDGGSGTLRVPDLDGTLWIRVSPADDPAGGPVLTVSMRLQRADHAPILVQERVAAGGSVTLSLPGGVARHWTLSTTREWPRVYRSLAEALAAIAADPRPREVVQIEDDASYREDLTWPAGCLHLCIQAAERHRPLLLVDGSAVDAAADYGSLELLGLALASDHASLALPPAATVSVRFCSLMSPTVLAMNASGQDLTASFERCICAGLALDEGGSLTLRDCVLGLPGETALAVPDGSLTLERVTVFGGVEAGALDASEVLFDGPLYVYDRFRGCIRYSRVPAGTIGLPREHRVVREAAPRLVSRDRLDPAYGRLAADTDPRILRGAEDGAEIGAFARIGLHRIRGALGRRLEEYTPAGLVTGIIARD